MWLRNYYNMLTAFFLADDTLSSSSQPSDYDPPIMIHTQNNAWTAANSRAVSYSLNSTNYMSYVRNFIAGNFFGKELCSYSRTPSEGFGIFFGSGSTPVTYDDYNLETPITSGLSVVSQNGTLTQPTSYDNATHHISSKRSFTVNNSSASPITVSEFGIFVNAGASTGDYAMIYREVLATPITLNPSESAIITFERDAEVYNYTPY